MDLSVINQSSQWIDQHLFLPFYQGVNQKVYVWAPFIGIVDGMLSLIQGVTSIVEAVFKGLLNFSRGEFLLGSLQIVLGAGIITIALIPVVINRILKVIAQSCLGSQHLYESS